MILAPDIGYSNLNIAYGEFDSDTPLLKMIPATATPSSLITRSLTQLRKTDESFFSVDVNGEKWTVGIPANKIQNFTRQLHGEFTGTNEWLAMLKASLVASGVDTIELLILGLPTEQFYDDKRKDIITRLASGKHIINSSMTKIVENVLILPQPAGAWMDLISSSDISYVKKLQKGKILVIDPGYFSVDSALFSGGEFFNKSSTSSLWAVSRILEEVDERIATHHGGNAGVEKLEIAIKNQDKTVMVHGTEVEIDTIVKESSKHVSELALSEILKSLRSEAKNIDIILLAGGGANFYKESVNKFFPNSQVVVADDHVNSIAKGFWHYGKANFNDLISATKNRTNEQP
jgi:plasmid segregation protein ParM